MFPSYRLLPLFLALTAAAGPARAAGSAELAAPETLVDAVVVTGQASAPGPTISLTGANAYSTDAAQIAALPVSGASALTEVLTQMPGVSIDQNQQIHIRDTEGPQFQYQIDGAFVPLDINTNPPFLSMINPMFIKRLDLMDGVLPARYSYATGGVLDIETKDGCSQPGGSVEVLAGQRETIAPSGQYGGCAGRLSYYVSGLYSQGDTAFSSATAGADAVHDHGRQAQAFGVFTWAVDSSTSLRLVASGAASDNQLPNVPGMAPAYALAGAPPINSASIDSRLNFRDWLGILSLKSEPAAGVTWQIAYAIHAIRQDFLPDEAGELIYQGVASRASHSDFDNTLQGDANWKLGPHTLGAGFYAGAYHVVADDSSLVFPADAAGDQTSDVPVRVLSGARATNLLLGLYADDLVRLTGALKVDIGLRWDSLTGFTNHSQIDPTVNFVLELDEATTAHAGFARYMQVPSFQGISPGAVAAFAGTTAATGPGTASPKTEDDYEWDGGVTRRVSGSVSLSLDGFYERTLRYLDTGQFGMVPIFAPYNYGRGWIWGVEASARYHHGPLSAYANLTVGRNFQRGVITGQFNFDPDELAQIDSRGLVLDHAPLVGVASGLTWAHRGWTVSLDEAYSSGLRSGFADQTALPQVIQVNAAVARSWRVPGVGQITNRVTVLNLFDRVNLIRPQDGIGIFQSAYGPRLTVLDSLSLAF